MAVSDFPLPALPTFPTPTGNILWVDASGGSDSWPGTQVQPKQTIQAAVDASAPSTTVMIAPTGVYHEQVVTTAKSKITLRSSHPTQRPVIDGDHIRSWGVLYNGGASGQPNVYGLEIRNVKFCGIQCGTGAIVWGNVIHAVGEKGTPTVDANSQGIKFGGRGGQIKQNFIYNVGFAGEARGILLQNTGDVLVEQNVIYNARKEGIRLQGPSPPPGFTGNLVRNNIFAMCWVGFCGNGDFGTQFYNNLSLDCMYGVNNKHHYFDAAAFPGIPTPLPAAEDPTLSGWSRTHHNTFLRCTHASIWPCVNVPHGDFYSYQDNLMVDAGQQYLFEFPDTAVHGPNYVFNNNVYVTSGAGIRLPQWLARMKGYQDVPSAYVYTLTALKAWTNANFGPEWPGVTGLAPYEAQGQEKSMTQVAFNDLPAGDVDYAGTLVGADLNDGYGTQVGARGLTPPLVRWHLIKAVSATANYHDSYAVRTIDELPDSYYYAGQPLSSGLNFTYDFGSPVTFTYFKFQYLFHQTSNNPHTFALQTSNTNNGSDWVTVTSVILDDAEVATYHWNLDQVLTARYVRLFNMTSFEYPATGWSTGITFSDFAVGTVSLAHDPTTLLIDGYVSPDPDVTPPTNPANLVAANITPAGFDFTWNASTDNVAVDHYVYRVTGGLEAGTAVSTTSLGFQFVTTDPLAQTYTVHVKAVDTSANESSEVSITVDKPAVPAPTVNEAAYWGVLAFA